MYLRTHSCNMCVPVQILIDQHSQVPIGGDLFDVMVKNSIHAVVPYVPGVYNYLCFVYVYFQMMIAPFYEHVYSRCMANDVTVALE